MSDCAVCVYDLYEELLAAYNTEVEALRKALTVMPNAFEEMERALARQQTKDQSWFACPVMI